jgi:hypothetical protein
MLRFYASRFKRERDVKRNEVSIVHPGPGTWFCRHVQTDQREWKKTDQRGLLQMQESSVVLSVRVP